MKFITLSVVLSIIIIFFDTVTNKSLQGLAPRNHHRHYEEKPEDIMSLFMENTKKEFLWGLNLSGVPSQDKIKKMPPQFMIELYNRFSEDKTLKPVSNIIRSFNAEDILSSSALEDTFQSHIVLFNVSIPQHEELTEAELKMYVSLGKKYHGHLLVYDILYTEPFENLRYPKSLIESKIIERSGWLSINVTRAVKRWITSSRITKKLEIFLGSNKPLNSCLRLQDNRRGVKINSSYPPVLLVFSDDKWSKPQKTKMERKEIIFHEENIGTQTVSKKNTVKYANNGHKNWNFGLGNGKMRVKRSQATNYCRKSSLKVNFKDIGWDSWIISPPEYDAYECKGECYYPLTDNLTPTKHAIIQTLMHFKNPKITRKACCVPTQLEPISIFYIDDKGIPTMKYKYEGMKVAKCGCR
ncbi:hypothetical protein XENTR_v10018532 [Xenopus tropicalis]|uniref:Growth differentiation factor 2 n=1 Tax=Xenopus tropicalis TaxID=8364 RepID=A0A6I8R6N3_XENTR|nr:growth/differentiation factor 2 isoform X1 [Xenopus tropicalis]KAE8591656.1 hypothetical protein XENTR_v10018532 [Xenopus tropicalis]KAE8591657.1 hypothetical protein XENTR_v10018532 [Xenopus tropicalis]|eukprot:XP_002940692.2 PREDICTED: growth/differentiation factor 2 isoform X1 [Xenopus tropicalis]